MKIELSFKKSVEENASVYFDKSKKAKKKLEGISGILEEYKKKLDVLQEKLSVQEKQEKLSLQEDEDKIERKKEWYEKFRWFFTSEGFLVVGGRDATSNEIIIKKHTAENDLVFHTDMSGSPFFVIKSDDKQIGDASIKEVASATACYSRAWRAGHLTASVFYVKPDQVTKEAQSGEYLSKGSFMIRGKTNYVIPEMKIAIGLDDDVVIGGPVDSIKSKTQNYVVLVSGNVKSGAIAKKIRSALKSGDLDEIIKFIPAGGSAIENSRR